jgi:hypothetical protein
MASPERAARRPRHGRRLQRRLLGAPEWLERLVPPERAVEICQRITVDRGRSFARTLLGNVPAMMFLFLPLMALVMKVAYPLSGATTRSTCCSWCTSTPSSSC